AVSAPASKKGAASADNAAAARTKGKKGEQLAAQPSAEHASDGTQHTLRGKQRPAKSQHEPAAAPAASAVAPAAEEAKPAVSAALTAAEAPAAAAAAEPAPIVLDIPLPPMPEGPPADLVQSVFASSPLP